jgi:hypothetical protein
MACILGAWLGAIGWYGGAGDQARALMMGLIAVGLATVGLTLGKRVRLPPLGWWWPLAAVAILLPLWQVMPLHAVHPWSHTDSTLLGSQPQTWAINPDTTWRSVAWGIAMAGGALLAIVAWRGERSPQLARWVVAGAAIHALIALPLASLLPQWPAPDFAGRVRGTFVYPNHAADLWGACLPLALALVRAERTHRLYWMLAALTLGTALILSASRGGILCAAVVTAPFAWSSLPRRHRLWWAVGAGATLSAWLVALNLETVTSKFASLAGEQGATLSGRIHIWQTAWPAIKDTLLLGAGPGSEPLTFLRGGTEYFGTLTVDRLHSDPLEWLACYGVVGATALSAALLWAGGQWVWRYRQAAGRSGRRTRIIARGAGAGLLVLLLHCMAEFSWHSPAIAVTGLLLVVIASGCVDASRHKDARPSRNAWPLRLGLIAAALLVGLAASIEWPLAAEDARAWHGRGAAERRQQQGLAIDRADAVQQLLNSPASSVISALAQAEVALAANPDDPNRELIARDLNLVAQRSPIQPMAWVIRGRLALLDGDRAALATALDRLQALAPAWGPTRGLELAVLLSEDATLIDDDRKRIALRSALTGRGVRWGLPDELFEQAGDLLGASECEMLLEDAMPSVAEDGLSWLASEGSLESWLNVTYRLQPDKYSAASWLSAQALGYSEAVTMSNQLQERHDLARQLGSLRLPLPPTLLAALQLDGPPGSVEPRLWLEPGVPPSLAWLQGRAETGTLLRTWLHHPTARTSWEDCRQASELLAGHSASLDNSAWPPVIDLALTCVQDPSEHMRLLGLAQATRLSSWEFLPDTAGASRWWDASRGWPTIQVTKWTGVAIDGEWLGWQRGVVSFDRARWNSGLHIIQLLNAP